MIDKTGDLKCDMKRACVKHVTHIDEMGFVYCRDHGIQRKSYCRCRLLQPKELAQLKAGQPLASY